MKKFETLEQKTHKGEEILCLVSLILNSLFSLQAYLGQRVGASDAPPLRTNPLGSISAVQTLPQREYAPINHSTTENFQKPQESKTEKKKKKPVKKMRIINLQDQCSHS